ncbi:MAG: protein kinase [Sandaracinaceae bacterium]|nr:protein kinase [Sandaracinaceae bacterium]
MWSKAAESIAVMTGVHETVQALIHGRAFRHFSEGLRQYLTIRLGGIAAGDDALNELRSTVSTWPPDQLVQLPGPRAHLYRLAHELIERRLMERGKLSPGTMAQLPWREHGRPIPTDYADALKRIRTQLPPEDSELLELHYARELSEEELAFMFDRAQAEVEADLARVLLVAERILGRTPPSVIPGTAGALIEAFALEPPPSAAENIGDAPTQSSLTVGAVIGDRYRLDKKVGAGAFGDVFRASDTEVPGHTVALKLLHQPSLSETAKAAALRELLLIASVFHPSIVQFKDHGWYEGRLWFVMPWYAGETLEARMTREPLSRSDARKIFEPLARALATMHAVGIRHQDVKPDNIFLARLEAAGSDGEGILPVLLDLGVAAKEAEVMLAGTPMYFAPEVAAQFASLPIQHNVTISADIFSLALSLRNALEPSTQEEVAGGAVAAFVEYRAQNRPQLPVDKDLRFLNPYFERWLSPDPDKRPTAEAFVRELAVLTAPEERKERRRRTLRWLLPTAFALLSIFGAAVYVLQKNAQYQRLQALEARSEASSARADLSVANARRVALQEGISTLQSEINSSQFTRAQLATELATKQGQIRILREDIARADRNERQLRTSLTETEARRAQLDTDLTTTRGQLATSEARGTQLTNDLSRARQDIQQRDTMLAEARGEAAQFSRDLSEARSRIAQLSSDTDNLRAQIAAFDARGRDLERRLADQERRLAEAESARARAESEVDDLRRQLARANSTPRTNPTLVPGIDAQQPVVVQPPVLPTPNDPPAPTNTGRTRRGQRVQ